MECLAVGTLGWRVSFWRKRRGAGAIGSGGVADTALDARPSAGSGLEIAFRRALSIEGEWGFLAATELDDAVAELVEFSEINWLDRLKGLPLPSPSSGLAMSFERDDSERDQAFRTWVLFAAARAVKASARSSREALAYLIDQPWPNKLNGTGFWVAWEELVQPYVAVIRSLSTDAELGTAALECDWSALTVAAHPKSESATLRLVWERQRWRSMTCKTAARAAIALHPRCPDDLRASFYRSGDVTRWYWGVARICGEPIDTTIDEWVFERILADAWRDAEPICPAEVRLFVEQAVAQYKRDPNCFVDEEYSGEDLVDCLFQTILESDLVDESIKALLPRTPE